MERSLSIVGVNEEVVDSKSYNKRNLNGYLFLMLMVDYVVTYLGIHHYEFIREANALFVWLFNLPFAQGFLVRVVGALFVTGLYQYIYMEGNKHYKKVITFALSVNIVIMFLHIRWLSFMLYLTIIYP